jgi:AsmA-like C-terminal region
MKILKTARIALAALFVILVVGGIVLATHWPFSEGKIKQSLQETFPATVTFQKFHATYFPHPGCIAEGVIFTRLGAPQGLPPIVTTQNLKIEAHYWDIVLRPGYLARIVMQSLHAQVPVIGTKIQDTGWKETPSKIRVGEIIADGAAIEIARSGSHEPLRFDVYTLKLSDVGRDKPLSYDVYLHNPLPPGEVRSHGKFGPWNSNEAGRTPLEGEYTFRHADLSVFDGIAGLLSSEDSFQGLLQRIEARGNIDIADFMLTHTHHPVHVSSEFHAYINGTNGDVSLDSVNAGFLHTNVQAKGEIAGRSGQNGKTASIDLHVRDGHIQDVLLLFVKEPRPPLNGTTSFNAHVTIPPEDRPFLEKVRLVGTFGIHDGHFVKPSTRTNVEQLSEKTRGLKTDSPRDPQDAEQVISNLSGHLELRNATTNFSEFSFSVPGAEVQMHGTYNIESKAIDLHGTLKTESEFSNMTSGFKSVLLKPFNVFFQRKHGGALLPVHLVGTYENPQAGLDLPAKKGGGGKSPSGAN